MGVDLLRQQQRWKSTLMEIRHLMASLVHEGFNQSNMRPWKVHWDHQMYKALEHQYQLGLEALNQNLPEIKVELVYRCVREREKEGERLEKGERVRWRGGGGGGGNEGRERERARNIALSNDH